jgi:hypothetical protein
MVKQSKQFINTLCCRLSNTAWLLDLVQLQPIINRTHLQLLPPPDTED